MGVFVSPSLARFGVSCLSEFSLTEPSNPEFVPPTRGTDDHSCNLPLLHETNAEICLRKSESGQMARNDRSPWR